MKVHLHIDAPISTTESVTDITFDNNVMVSLDCCGCHRCGRSVVLHKLKVLSYCTPTRHKFNGRILEVSSTKDEVRGVTTGRYLIEYEFATFIDAKYPERISKPGSTWARVRYSLRCACGANVTHETQNNQVRPIDISCGCGAVLVTEAEEIPRISEASAG